ncbi:hypothetical protein HYH03_011418 [Edaphochlamys debaryana]|uniref:Ankyrin repeat domain-containing protein n=1 Tax=Edaphochlamys debaryana TaxID=47281 RepID=A0A835XRZ9_9CHLO|nr:hypothetical protein HYH03_011418 [Edaphochlamys debaryana]|eukprot:KAG2490112.1 hypothetical protein HYH03_011418 [Edaphochlamys debaryana]
MEWLLQQAAELAAAEAGTRGEACGREALAWDLGVAATEGCDLAVVVNLSAPRGPGQPPYLPAHWPMKGGWRLLAAALFSRGLDWQRKVEWVLARGNEVRFTDPETQRRLYRAGADRPKLEALPERFDWLRNQGCSPVGSDALRTALREGSAQAVGWLLANGAAPDAQAAVLERFLEAIWHAAVSGHLPALHALREGMALGPAHWNPLLHGAAKGGQLRVLTLAALAGDPAVLRWMREHGAAWEPRAWLTGVASGSEAAVEVLGELGCPQPDPDLLYGVALQKRLWQQLPALHRAGVPLGPDPAAVLAFALVQGVPEHVRTWVLGEAGIEPQAEAAAAEAAEAAGTALSRRAERVVLNLEQDALRWLPGNNYDWEWDEEGEDGWDGGGHWLRDGEWDKE